MWFHIIILIWHSKLMQRRCPDLRPTIDRPLRIIEQRICHCIVPLFCNLLRNSYWYLDKDNNKKSNEFEYARWPIQKDALFKIGARFVYTFLNRKLRIWLLCCFTRYRMTNLIMRSLQLSVVIFSHSKRDFGLFRIEAWFAFVFVQKQMFSNRWCFFSSKILSRG